MNKRKYHCALDTHTYIDIIRSFIISLKYQVHVQLTLFFIAALTIPVKKISSFMSTEHASIRSESYNSSPFLMALIFLAASLSPAKTNRYNNLNKLIYIIKDK